MVPPPEDEPPIVAEETPPPRLRHVRVALGAIAAGWICVFAVALQLDPYRGGRVWRDETHTQLGFPPCTFRRLSDLPCPACGMTTSFALFVRADLVNSARANFAGTFLAAIGFAYLPWALGSVFRGRWLFFREIEPIVVGLALTFAGVMLVRWLAVLAWLTWFA